MEPTWLPRLERIQTVLHGYSGAANIILGANARRAAAHCMSAVAAGRDAVARCLSAVAMISDKPALRAAMRALRKRLAGADPLAASRAADHAGSLPAGETVALYRAIGSELGTDALAQALIAAGRTLCLPVALERDAAMIFRLWSPGEPLEMDAAGCPAPLPLAATVTPDLIVTPLLAFDDSGGRLGQGGGFYDRTFAVLPDVARVGFAYDGQRLDGIPIEPHDQRLHGVLTEVGYTPARKV
jgi:5-formyltetrahydrofolate cyclo-ligase